MSETSSHEGQIISFKTAALLCLVLGALPFSVFLFRLGEDMVSPEFLRYTLIATAPLALLLTAVLFFRRRRLKLRVVLFESICLSALQWIPLELIAFVTSNWRLRGNEVFALYNFSPLLILLLVWATAAGGFCAVVVMALWESLPSKNRNSFHKT
jgi:hypothetical protein